MSSDILVGVGREMRFVSDAVFIKSVKTLPARMKLRLAFMSPDHHRVRDFVVRELPKHDSPISQNRIAHTTSLTLQTVAAVLTELERNLFFLVRDLDGNVTWAFPVTTSRTPHRLRFSTGEKIFGA